VYPFGSLSQAAFFVGDTVSSFNLYYIQYIYIIIIIIIIIIIVIIIVVVVILIYSPASLRSRMCFQICTHIFEEKLLSKVSVNPLSPNKDENEISLYIVTSCSNIRK